MVGSSLSFPCPSEVSSWCEFLRRSGSASGWRWLRGCREMGGRHPESTPTGSKRTTTKTSPRVGAGRLAKTMLGTFVALAVLTTTSAATAQALEFVGRIEWQPDPVQGVSGLEVSADGLNFVAMSDQGWRLQGEFERDREGRIADVHLHSVTALLGQDGWPVTARRVGDWSDAEGLAIDADGTEWVSFERWAHVWTYENAESVPVHIKDHPTFYDYADNRQLEAIAVHPDGTVITLPESATSEGFPIYELDSNRWVISGHLPKADGFLLVGADFSDAGDLFVLERKLVLGLWWQSRIRKVAYPSLKNEILWTSKRGEFHNLEGIAVWPSGKSLRITLVSDNNTDPDEPTEFVEFRLTE